MNLTISSILRITGMVLVVISIAMLPPILVSLYYGEYHVAMGFVHSIWIGLIVGLFLFAVFRSFRRKLRVRDGYMIIALCWIAASVFGAFPYYYADVLGPINAFFESASGFSTTGATVFDDVESVPKGILIWRSLTQWLGGLGILVFAVALMPALGINGTSVAEPDRPSVSIDALSPKAKRIAFVIFLMFGLLTLTEAILLCIGGMGKFDSVIHAMSTMSTGGFSSYNDSIMHFDSIYIRIVIFIFMIIAGTNFTMFYSYTRRGIKAFTEDTEFKMYLIIMAVAFVAVFAGIFFIETGWSHPGEAANSAFQVVSILTTTGFVSDNFTLWPAFCQMILILLMFIGGCSSSASSGNKVVRITVIIKLVHHGIQTRLHSNVVRPVRINLKDVPKDTVSAVVNSVYLYMITVFIGAFAMAFENINLLDCFTSTISLLGNVGPCFGSIGTSGIFADFSAFTKVFMSFVMIAGRLEIYTLLVLLTPGFWRAD